MKLRSLSAFVFALAALATPSVAYGGEDYPSDDTITIDGQEYGTEDGLRIVEISNDVSHGKGTVGESFTESASGSVSPMTTWGTSYAYSVEAGSQVFYKGYAKAAGNVYEGERIAKVCMWYTQGSRTSSQVCASAKFVSGSWQASSEVETSFRDTLDSDAPQTVFHYKTYRVPIRG